MLISASLLLGREVVAVSELSGGDLSKVFRLHLSDGTTAIAKQAPLVAVEARMLTAMRDAGVPVPAVMAQDGDVLVMEDIAAVGRAARSWVELAEMLDILHSTLGPHYGWPDDYAFGDVEISNRPGRDWCSFWADQRLRCHLPFVDFSLGRRIEALCDRLGELLPARPAPALLHGDLWSGNILFDNGGIAALIDPACCFGDHEVDLAMLGLFDRPPAAFFDACGPAQGWEQRQPVYQLWPLLVHLRLFGGAYAQQAGACLGALGF